MCPPVALQKIIQISRLKNTVCRPYHNSLRPDSNIQTVIFSSRPACKSHRYINNFDYQTALYRVSKCEQQSCMFLIPTISVSFLSHSHNERKVTCKHPVTGVPSQDNCIFVVNEQWVTSFSLSLHSFLQHWVRNRALCLKFTQKSHSSCWIMHSSNVVSQRRRTSFCFLFLGVHWMLVNWKYKELWKWEKVLNSNFENNKLKEF